jgi:hypothetical protein
MPNSGAVSSTTYYQLQLVSEAALAHMRGRDALHLEHPFAGTRLLSWLLKLANCLLMIR